MRSGNRTVIITFAAAMVASAPAFAQKLPAEIAAPGETTVLTLHAQGAQIYACAETAEKDGKFAWSFREPIAALLLDGKTVGRHYAGPNWEYMDGSAVVAKVSGSAPGATPKDIPWLRLAATSHRGMGVSASDWQVFIGHLEATLEKFGVATAERITVLGFVDSMKVDIVE